MHGDSTNTSKVCRHCHTPKPIGEFRIRRYKLRSGGRSQCVLGRCNDCVRAYQRQKQTSPAYKKTRDGWSRLKRFGLTPEDFAALFASQNGVCAICGRPESKLDFRSGVVQSLSVDHCHQTGLTRGLLCNTCNRGIGYFQDSPERLQAAIRYLHRYTSGG